ncbi:MAG: histidine phosphatase family protein [Oscillospiraceae bacterium]|nr:histidine phosphatase family protein [Oscillospiraceae bacterium]
MKGYKINLLRHGQTEANAQGRYIGVTDEPLSEGGEAELLEKYEKHPYPKVPRVYSSPLLRAVQSARILFPQSEIIIADGLREMDFGAFEGLKAEELINLDSYKGWLKGGIDNPPPNGESVRELTARCYNAIDSIILDMMRASIFNAAVLTHSGIMMNLLSCFGLPKLDPMAYACGAGEGWEIHVTAMMWQRDGIFEITGRAPAFS